MTETKNVPAVPETAVVTTETVSLMDVATFVPVARQYRRDIALVLPEAIAMATVDPEIASQCWYTLKYGSTDIEGPSVRLAEMMVSAWGNMAVSIDSFEEHEDYVLVRGFVVDTEKNIAIQDFCTTRIVTKAGKRYSADVIKTSIEATRSKLYRNLVFRIIPRAFTNRVLDEAMTTLSGGATDHPTRVSKMFEFWQDGHSIEAKAVLEYLEIEKQEEVTPAMLQEMVGLAQAVQDGKMTAERALQPAGSQEDLPKEE